METSTSTNFTRLHSAREAQARKDDLLELLLYWFAYAFALAGGGVLFGLLFASGGSLSNLLGSGPGVLNISMIVLFVIGGAVFLIRKTRALVMPHDVSGDDSGAT